MPPDKVRGRTHNGLGASCGLTGVTAGGPRRLRVEVSLTVLGRPLKSVQVLDGGRGRMARNGQVRPLSKEELDEEGERLHVGVASHLVALRDQRFRVAPPGEAQVNGRDAAGVRVRRAGRRDVNLYFHKMTGLPLRTECLVKGLESGGRGLVVQTTCDDHRPVGGARVAHRFTTRRDGRPYAQSEAVAVRVAGKLDDRLFARPGE
jgi:hypothetical protein